MALRAFVGFRRTVVEEGGETRDILCVGGGLGFLA